MTSMNRRKLLTLVAVTAGGAPLLSRAAFAEEAGADAATLLNDADVCVITPEVTEGPYYFDPALERADIREDRVGVPATVRLQVVDAMCKPIDGARVDIWHCDADGLYSGYRNQTGGADTTGETFLRGTQFSNGDGIAEFISIYPGWYQGRTTHIHFKVFLDTATVLTGQIFFHDETSDAIYASTAPYNSHSGRSTRNDNDRIAQQGGAASMASVEQAADAYLVQMIIGVNA
jgi:protocatechuate 3,4-dioxygenase beta subunit